MPDQQQRFWELICMWAMVFAAHEEDIEWWSLLWEMLESGVIAESASPWAVPVVLMRKKDGAWHFCVDYLRLNAVTHQDAYPLSRIEESLTGLKLAEWYSTLDLASGYWQVEVDPADREKMAFATPMGIN
ncbi:hypothetical protein SKAU_G00155730 [Synaphobranchus kaupii]|uniref:ribonuclease H n=1 Tax=Synaphobranchus kaupii TaxID=118154 RepID=A0A9Q1FHH9_SYNKA|nr:hypothetical protein SKAU_G00155730 [Synaphobranchus kaupii]